MRDTQDVQPNEELLKKLKTYDRSWPNPPIIFKFKVPKSMQ